jgi:hypothetical protein
MVIEKTSILSPEKIIELGDKGILGQGSGNLIDNFAVFKKNKGWDSPDSVVGGAERVFAGVDLGDNHAPEKMTRNPVNNRSQRPARAAAWRIQVEQQRQVGLADQLGSLLVADFNRHGVCGHGQRGLAFTAPRFTMLFAGGHFILGLAAGACNNQSIHGMWSVFCK